MILKLIPTGIFKTIALFICSCLRYYYLHISMSCIERMSDIIFNNIFKIMALKFI